MTDAMRESLATRGFATSGPIVAAGALGEMRARYDRLMAGHQYGGQRGLVQVFGAGKLEPDLVPPELFAAVNRAAVQLLAGLDGVHPAFDSATSTVVPRTTSQTMGCICKPARTAVTTEYHQDEAYSSPEIERLGVTAQLSLQQTTADSGCMMFISGSSVPSATTHCLCCFQPLFLVACRHRLPVLEHTLAPHRTYDPIDDSTFDELQLTPEASALVDWGSAVACPVEAGSLTRRPSRGARCCSARATRRWRQRSPSRGRGRRGWRGRRGSRRWTCRQRRAQAYDPHVLLYE
eukprot:COSAG04_NODE_1530_length_6451_cov_2.039830_3_plen_292_part_00